MNRIEQAVHLFDEGFNCSQAILATYGPQLGLDKTKALKVAAGFGGGIGCMGDTCGALTGAFMVLGLKHGSTDGADKDAKIKTYELVRKAAKTFENHTGTIICRDLLGFDLNTPEGKEKAKEEGAFDICRKLIKDAAEILEEILGED